SSSIFTGTEREEVPRNTGERLRCSICARRLGKTLAYLEETGDVPEPRLSWLLCEACGMAVREQMARANLQSPLRLRVAVAMVSTERTPQARRAHFGQLSDSAWIKLLFWAFILGLLAHLIAIIIVAGISH
ncbi:MAG TPA: hypothetical protein VFY89_09600, partial [Ktedonobacterales bacterium]